MAEAATMPSLSEVMGWVGAEVSDIGGSAVGQVHGLYVDGGNGDPAWLVVQAGRRRSSRLVAVPLHDCAGAAFGVWVAQEGERLRSAPVVDPSRPLRREHELTICAHFGIGEGVGRAAEVAGRPEGDVTAEPARA
jgi:PRC-barrel domain